MSKIDFNDVHVTDHAHDMLKERVGLPKSSHKTHAKKVLNRGEEVEDGWEAMMNDDHNSDFMIRHGEFLYPYVQSSNDYVLITAFYDDDGVWTNQ